VTDHEREAQDRGNAGPVEIGEDLMTIEVGDTMEIRRRRP